MRRADRLFQIIQILRRSSRPVTATMLAGELEISIRTVYRDMADLIGQRVPIAGEAGLGYILDSDYDMPPSCSHLMRSRRPCLAPSGLHSIPTHRLQLLPAI